MNYKEDLIILWLEFGVGSGKGMTLMPIVWGIRFGNTEHWD